MTAELITQLGRKLASHDEIAAVEIKIKNANGTLTEYRSNEDPQFFKKYQAYEESIGLTEKEED